MDAATEIGRNSVSKHQIQPEEENKQTDAGRNAQTRLARPNSQEARTGTGNIHFPCSADHDQDWQPSYPIDPYSAIICDDHTYIHTCIHTSYIYTYIHTHIHTYIHAYNTCVCVCFLPIHSGHQVRWTYQPGSHRRKVTQDF